MPPVESLPVDGEQALALPAAKDGEAGRGGAGYPVRHTFIHFAGSGTAAAAKSGRLLKKHNTDSPPRGRTTIGEMKALDAKLASDSNKENEDVSPPSWADLSLAAFEATPEVSPVSSARGTRTEGDSAIAADVLLKAASIAAAEAASQRSAAQPAAQPSSRMALSLSDRLEMPYHLCTTPIPISKKTEPKSPPTTMSKQERPTTSGRDRVPTTPVPRSNNPAACALEWSPQHNSSANSRVSATALTQTPPSSFRSSASTPLGPMPSIQLDGDGIFFSVTIRRAESVAIGLRLDRSVDGRILQVRAVLPGGAVEAFNRQSAGGAGVGKLVLPGDKIVCVNGKTDCFSMFSEFSSKLLSRILVVRGGPDHELCVGSVDDA